MTVRVDPQSGLKVFDTRAAKASDAIAGKGYSIVTDEALKALPEPPTGATFNAEEQAKYRAFKEARRGAADYMAMDGDFAKYLDDVYSAAPAPREALDDECEILVVGAGFGGLLLWQKLREAGFADVRFCEKGGDVGGTWYWNRYPGIACDVEAYSYLPLLEETGYVPAMKFASGFEILEYCQRMADKFGFYERCLFHTRVEETKWDEAAGPLDGDAPNRGDAMKSPLRDPGQWHPDHAQARPHRRHEKASRARAFHTSRWDYNVELAGKRVGIIGTGATAVQAIPELAKIVRRSLTVFQRTPSSIDVRDQRATTDEEREQVWARTSPVGRRAQAGAVCQASPAGRTALQANDDYLVR